MEFLVQIFLLLLYVIPLYAANSIPVVVHGRTPIDLNRKLFGKPIFGKGKTIIGLLAGVTAGTLAGAALALAIPTTIQLIPNYFEVSFYLALGAIIGDLVKSFFKRRFGIKSGEKWVVADQLDFIIGGILLSLIVRPVEPWLAVLLAIGTIFIHSGTNWIAFELGLKKVPW